MGETSQHLVRDVVAQGAGRVHRSQLNANSIAVSIDTTPGVEPATKGTAAVATDHSPTPEGSTLRPPMFELRYPPGIWLRAYPQKKLHEQKRFSLLLSMLHPPTILQVLCNCSARVSSATVLHDSPHLLCTRPDTVGDQPKSWAMGIIATEMLTCNHMARCGFNSSDKHIVGPVILMHKSMMLRLALSLPCPCCR